MFQPSPAKTSTAPHRNAAISDISTAIAIDFRQALLAVRDLRETSATGWTLWVGLLQTQYAMPGHTVTATRFAAAHRLSSNSAALLSYNKLGRAVAAQLGYEPPDRSHGKHEPMWWMTLSTGSDGNERDAGFTLTMHPELAQALELMRWVQPQPAGA